MYDQNLIRQTIWIGWQRGAAAAGHGMALPASVMHSLNLLASASKHVITAASVHTPLLV